RTEQSRTGPSRPTGSHPDTAGSRTAAVVVCRPNDQLCRSHRRPVASPGTADARDFSRFLAAYPRRSAMSLLRRLLPRPLLSLLLWATWLLLNNSLAPGHLLLGFILAVAVPFSTAMFWNPQPSLKRPLLMARFVLILLYDIVVANFEVARKVLGRQRALRPAFIEYPLDLRQ